MTIQKNPTKIVMSMIFAGGKENKRSKKHATEKKNIKNKLLVDFLSRKNSL